MPVVDSTNKEWIDGTVEEALEPDLPICDPHHHFWEFRYERPAHHYLLDDLLADIGAGHNVVSTVFIECSAMYRRDGPEEMRVVGEVEFVNGIAAMSASGLYGEARVAAGIVGHADLTLGSAVGAVLDAQVAAGGGRFRGIRHIVTWEDTGHFPPARTNPGPRLLLDPGFHEGFAELGPRGLGFEAWCFHPQLPEVTDLARAFPDTTIVLDHFGGPLGVGPYAGRRDEIFESWSRDVATLATCPNVVAKLGGINMDLNGFGWHERERPPTSAELVEATRRYYEHTIDVFGPDRCMFESNFPVDMISCGYVVLWNAFKRLTANYSDAEKAALYHDTATRVYRL